VLAPPLGGREVAGRGAVALNHTPTSGVNIQYLREISQTLAFGKKVVLLNKMVKGPQDAIPLSD